MIKTKGGQVAGYWKLEAEKPNGARRLAADWFPNLITDAGLDGMGTIQLRSTFNGGNGLNAFCQVGSGNTAPTVGDTTLAAFVGEQAAVTSSSEDDTVGTVNTLPRYGWVRLVYTFSVGVAAGNLAEIGVASNNVDDVNGYTLFSRALILDENGDPTTITILADEVLRATYELRNYMPTGDTNFNMTIAGVNHACVLRLAEGAKAPTINVGISEVFAYPGALVGEESTPNGSRVEFTNNGNAAYGSGDLFRDFSAELGIASGNFDGGIPLIKFDTFLGNYQVSFDPPIAKDDTNVLSMTVRAGPWNRYTIP